MTPPRVLVTRHAEQAGSLREGLLALGAAVVELPVIEIAPPADTAPLDAALAGLDHYDWAVFTSANAVVAVADRLQVLRRSWPPSTRVASVGPATTDAVRERLAGAVVALEPSEHRAEGLLVAFEGHPLEGCRLLLPVSDRARNALARGLRERQARVDLVTAYRNRPPQDLAARLAAVLAAGADLVTFASPSAVEEFMAAAPRVTTLPPAAVIGPVTEAAARKAGFAIAAMADPSTAGGLIAALRPWMARWKDRGS